MRIYILGETPREGHLAQWAKEKGWDVQGPPPWDLVILPLPRGEIPENMIAHLPQGQKIVCGIINESTKKLAEAHKWQLYPVLDDPLFTQENAVLSAEGAIFYAMRQADFALAGASCLVIGYGRIGKALTKMLRGLGAKVIVAARRPESRQEAGNSSIDTARLDETLPSVQLVFNTVPHPLVDQALLTTVSDNTLLVELASPPYGIDLPAAQYMGLRAWLESGIPGRYCPKSAAQALSSFIERSVLHG